MRDDGWYRDATGKLRGGEEALGGIVTAAEGEVCGRHGVARVCAAGRGVLEVVGGSKPFLMLWRQQPKAKRAEAVLGFSGDVVVV